jgi:hypothetical protein
MTPQAVGRVAGVGPGPARLSRAQPERKETMTALMSLAMPASGCDKTEYTLAPNVILVFVRDGTARLLDMGGNFYAVPAIGAQMLRATLEHGTAAAVRQVAARYDVACQQVEADLKAFCDRLQRQGIILGSRSRQRKRGTGWSRFVLSPAFRWVNGCLRAQETKAKVLLGLARLSFAVWGWERTLGTWQAYFDRCERPGRPGEWEKTVHTIDRAVRDAAAKHIFKVECKERALCCWALLRSAGLPASVVVGIDLFPLAGHCWCESGPYTLSDEPDRCAEFTPVARYESLERKRQP